MNRHQVLTGAVNSGDNCFSTGSVEGVPFTAYAAGCNIVILASDFTRVQIIPGILHGNVQVSCLDASTDVGKIAVAFHKTICIFEPTPLLDKTPSSHKLDYKWIQTASLSCDCNISVLSWNLEGTKLLSGGSIIQMWQLIAAEEPKTTTAEASPDVRQQHDDEDFTSDDKFRWDCVWRCRTANPVFFLEFSPDGSLFISAGKNDRLVKIWFESAAKNNYLNPHPASNGVGMMATSNGDDGLHSSHPFASFGHNANPLINQVSTTHPLSEVAYSFVYIAHPRAVTGISWRKTSKYTPRGCVANMLVTSCKDNICRIWVQTLLPDDGMVNVAQIEELVPSTNPRSQTQRHRQKFLQRIRQIRNFHQFKKRQKSKSHQQQESTDRSNEAPTVDDFEQPIPNLPSTYSVHDFHTFGVHGATMTPGLHFHLAAAINAETDIPLVPSLSSIQVSDHTKPTFVMHWLNNKEMTFTRTAEKLLNDVSLKIFQLEHAMGSSAPPSEAGSDVGEEAVEEDFGDHSDLDAEGEQSKKKHKHKLFKGSPMKKFHLGKHFKTGGEQDIKSPPTLIPVSSSASLRSAEVQDHLSPHNPHQLHVSNSASSTLGDFLDRKFESMLRKWQAGSDVLFSIHPVDGSLLVWLVDWLDETCPGSFRQAQVNFSTRIPGAIPLGDASTMSQKILLFSPYSFLDVRTLSTTNPTTPSNGGSFEEKSEPLSGALFGEKKPTTTVSPMTPTIFMVSKHINGSLNQWSISFAETTSFTQVLSVSHKSRVCGHRFRVNDIACHPVLPLLLTTSHHNLPGSTDVPPRSNASSPTSTPSRSPSPRPDIHLESQQPSQQTNTGFCSELILWKVDPVGPLSKSGGVTELARINSPNTSAFANVAWIPTLLPSSTLGSIVNSPSACFIASDGNQLRVYQAVIDARSLLAEISSADRRSGKRMDSSMYSGGGSDDEHSSIVDGMSKSHLKELFNVVSLQSTARPGCILQLSGISSAIHDWQNTQLLHVFQEQLIRGDNTYRSWAKRQESAAGLTEPGLDAVVDLRHSAVFEEPFYLVVIEKNEQSQSVIHMWKLVISSQNQGEGQASGVDPTTFAANIVQDPSSPDHSNASSRLSSPIPAEAVQDGQTGPSVTPVKITTVKVSSQVLPLPDDVEVVHATPAAGHLSSSNIYPACFAPYIICTACSDGSVRFWKCEVNRGNRTKSQQSQEEPPTPVMGSLDEEMTPEMSSKFKWVEWKMLLNENPSTIEVPGLPLYVSSAFSGRMACAYKHGQSYSKPHSANPETRYMNINLAIYECESTGGSEWVLEDTIKLKNIAIPQSEARIDLEPLIDSSMKNKKAADTLVIQLTSTDKCESRSNNIQRLLSVPSYATMQSLKRIISEKGNQFTLTQKSAVQLSWVSTEDGSHALTVSVGSHISVYTPVSTDIAQANLQAMQASSKTGTTTTASNRKHVMLKQVSMGVSTLTPPDDIRWMAIRRTDLSTADGLPPLPMQMSWVREGILVVGMDNEMHIYTQWKAQQKPEKKTTPAIEEPMDIRHLSEHNLLTKAQQQSQLRLPTVGHPMPRSPSSVALGGTSTPSSIAEKQSQGGRHVPQKDKEEDSETGGDTAATKDSTLFSQLPDFGIFEASRLACPVLPQYHPKQLMELLAFGKIQRVRAILRHLVVSLCSMDSMKSYLAQQHQMVGPKSHSPKPYRSRTLSISAPSGSPIYPLIPSPSADGTEGAIPEELQLDYTEITSIRPLPLFTLVDAEGLDSGLDSGIKSVTTSERTGKKMENGAGSESDSYSGLFDSSSKSQVEETLDEILNKSTFNFGANVSSKQKAEELMSENFGTKQSLLLTKLLTHSHLPGLSSTDQMHLIALADAVSSFNPDSMGTGGGNPDDPVVSYNSLDDCGLRFLLTIRQHTYLLRSLPISQRKQLHKDGISTSNMVWAFHSEAQEELVQVILQTQRGNIRWSNLRELGLGWWIRNNNILKRLMEQLAKAAFQSKNDPLDAALFYLAMRKKNLVWGLYRSISDKKMTEFFANNFSDEKWRKAALKNAYALMGKQRFEHAAAFFLLAGAVWDAVQICLSKLDDVQLAMVIVRLYEGDLETVPPTLKAILYQEVLGRNKDGTEYKSNMAHPDPFLRSMAYWILQDYSSSLTTLLDNDIGYDHPKATGATIEIKDDIWVHPSVFNFYLYLRTQPLIVRRHFAKNLQDKRDLTTESLTLSDAITTFERRLFFITAHQHFRAGCPSLALEVLSRLPGKIVMDDESILNKQESLADETHPDEIATGTFGEKTGPGPQKADEFDWSTPVKKEEPSALDLDWGAPVTNLGSLDTTFKIEIDPGSEEEEDDDDEGGLEMKSSKDSKEKKDEKVKQEQKKKPSERTDIKLDIMAQQLKFIACLKIIMEELSTLATGYEVDGGQLRYYLYVWLEKTVNALKTICSYRTLSMRGSNYRSIDVPRSASVLGDDLFPPERTTPRGSHSSDRTTGEKPSLHEILLADKLDFESKLERGKKRKEWLRSNEALLRTLLSYCSLHGAHGGGLASVRMELILLLQELQQEQNQTQLLSPLPFPTTLPLLAASVAAQKTVIADPLRHLQSMTHDIIQTVVELEGPPLILPPNYSEVYVLRDLGTSLSACIYQSLCDSENITWKGPRDYAIDFLGSSVVCPNSHLVAGRRCSMSGPGIEDLVPTTPPNKWPGVQSLRALLAKDKDEDAPKLHTLLCESYVAVFVSQLLYALAACDSHILFRLVGKSDITDKEWSSLFGGGAKKLIHVSVASAAPAQQRVPGTGVHQSPSLQSQQSQGSQRPQRPPPPSRPPPPQSSLSTTSSTIPFHQQLSQKLSGSSVGEDSQPMGEQLLSTLSAQRVKLHQKILQQLDSTGGTPSSGIPTPNIREDRPTYRETFVSPRMAILSSLMSKPKLPDEWMVLDYDSSESIASEEEEEEEDTRKGDVWDEDDLGEPSEKSSSDHEKYAWGIIRTAVIKLALQHINQFLIGAGIEVSDLPTISPSIHATLKTLDGWSDFMNRYLEGFEGPPPQLLPNVYVEATRTPGAPAMSKYKALLELNNTPFKGGSSTVMKPARRLWNFLVRQPVVQDVFVRYVFGNKPKSAIIEDDEGFTNGDGTTATGEKDKPDKQQEVRPQEIVRIVHRDHDNISSFCINHTNPNIIAIATPKEIQEMNISPLLESVQWLREEAEYDIKNLLK